MESKNIFRQQKMVEDGKDMFFSMKNCSTNITAFCEIPANMTMECENCGYQDTNATFATVTNDTADCKDDYDELAEQIEGMGHCKLM